MKEILKFYTDPNNLNEIWCTKHCGGVGMFKRPGSPPICMVNNAPLRGSRGFVVTRGTDYEEMRECITPEPDK